MRTYTYRYIRIIYNQRKLGSNTSSKEVGKQYFRVTNDFYLMQLTMMKGGGSQNNT